MGGFGLVEGSLGGSDGGAGVDQAGGGLGEIGAKESQQFAGFNRMAEFDWGSGVGGDQLTGDRGDHSGGGAGSAADLGGDLHSCGEGALGDGFGADEDPPLLFLEEGDAFRGCGQGGACSGDGIGVDLEGTQFEDCRGVAAGNDQGDLPGAGLGKQDRGSVHAGIGGVGLLVVDNDVTLSEAEGDRPIAAGFLGEEIGDMGDERGGFAGDRDRMFREDFKGIGPDGDLGGAIRGLVARRIVDGIGWTTTADQDGTDQKEEVGATPSGQRETLHGGKGKLLQDLPPDSPGDRAVTRSGCGSTCCEWGSSGRGKGVRSPSVKDGQEAEEGDRTGREARRTKRQRGVRSGGAVPGGANPQWSGSVG